MTLYWPTPIFSLAAPTAGCSNTGCPGAGRTTTGVFPLSSRPPGTFLPLLQTADPGKPQTCLEGGAVLVQGALGTRTSAYSL